MNEPRKVAVADDDRDTREYLQELLQRLGYQVAAATDGRELVELCRTFEPDVVLTDWQMPGLDGVAAAAEVSRERPIPVILLSGRIRAVDIAEGRGGVIVAYLEKPIQEKELVAALASVFIQNH